MLLQCVVVLGGCSEDPLGPELVSEPFGQLSVDSRTSCALTESGRAYCWGRGDNGQLGNGGASDQAAPVPVRTDLRFAHIAVGAYHACALTEAGEAWCWGANRRLENYGQLGNGRRRGGEAPERVRTNLRFTSLTAGQVHTCGLTADARAYCWGGNPYGQVGDGTTEDRMLPVPVAGELRFRALDSGKLFTCGVTIERAAYCWGVNFFGELGVPEVDDPCGPLSHPCTATPAALPGERAYAAVASGVEHTCAWTMEGAAYCWGNNTNAQLGKGDTSRVPGPVRVENAPAFRLLAAGGGFSCGLSRVARAYCWGSNRGGQVGAPAPDAPCANNVSCALEPTAVMGGHRFQTLRSGTFHSCALTPEGVAYCWGSNRRGQLGVGDDATEECNPLPGYPCSRSPVRVAGQQAVSVETRMAGTPPSAW